jgi:ADP-ribose pyrophosphatase YjhB (NUDIX family)
MHVDERILRGVRERYGRPRELAVELEISQAEAELVGRSTAKGRHHDITFFVMSGDRLALIRKPHYEPGLWRPPGGGLRPGEDFDEGVRREAREELGVEIELERYLVSISAVFRLGALAIPWRTHVLEALTDASELAPLDTREISAARFGTLEELAGPIRERLLATGRAFWRYRVALHDAAIEELRAEDPA